MWSPSRARDPVETGLRQLDGAQLAPREQRGSLGDAEIGRVGHPGRSISGGAVVRKLRGMAAVTVRLFAGLRERAGQGRVELDGVALVADVWAALALGDEPAGMLYAVNREYAEPTQELHDGDEVALIPPVSGGAFLVTGEPLDLAAAVAEVARDDAGAIATFVGTVRSSSRGRDVQYLEYEAYEEMAEPMLHRLGEELTAKHGLAAVADPPSRRPRRDRRAERRHRRVGTAPRRRARRVPRGDRHAQGDDPALEEGGLRGRRRMDRAGILMTELRDYDPRAAARGTERQAHPRARRRRSRS